MRRKKKIFVCGRELKGVCCYIVIEMKKDHLISIFILGLFDKLRVEVCLKVCMQMLGWLISAF